VAREVIKVRFLKKDGDFGRVFVPRVAEQYDRPIDG
jgi:hypothetical protein